MAVLLLDGCAQGIAFSVQSLKFRSVEEPAGEGNLRGSREGFADLLRVNLSLLRRLIRTEQLVQEVTQADCEMKTEYALCYCKGKVSPGALAQVRKILAQAKPGAAVCWIPAILCPGSFRAASGCFLQSAIPSARRWRRQNSARENHCSGQWRPLCHDFATPFAKTLIVWTIMPPRPFFRRSCVF